jgi:hypothetical protein
MKKIIIILSAIVLLLGTSACSDFLSVDETNPNQASTVAPKLVLPAALNASAAIMNTPGRFEFVYLWYGQWCISSSYSQPNDLTQYNIRNSSYEGNWTAFYINASNYNVIELASKDDPTQAYFLAMAKIMKAWIFHNLVDCYGNVAYSEAFDAPANLKPAYDDQVTIYEDLVKQIDEAIGIIKAAPADAEIAGANDIMYQGDMDLWIKFANTLKLRILMHQSDLPSRAGYITTNIATTLADGFLDADEGAVINPGYLKSTGKMNPFYEAFIKADGTNQNNYTYYMAGLNTIEYAVNTVDPRLPFIFSKPSGGYDGNYFGDLVANLIPADQTSKIGTGLIGTFDRSSNILTDVESLFLQAEAAQKGIIPGDANVFYDKAVTQSCKYYGVADADIAVFLLGGNVNFAGYPEKLKLIMTQKWFALNGISPMEVWTDYRRSGYPTFITFSADPLRKSNTPPVRLLYPQRELNLNSAAVAAQGTINLFTSYIFWDPNNN